MSYYHQNSDYDVYAYEYDDNSNHGNNKYKYDSYSDHYEPDHCGFEDSGYNNEDHGDSPEGFKYRHGEPDGDGYKPMEPGYKDEGQAHWGGGYNGEVEGYEHKEIEDKGDAIDETHEHNELVYKTRKLEELERMANEQGHALKNHNNNALGTNEYGHDDAHTSTRAYAHSTPMYVPPTSFSSTPAPIPLARDSPRSNLQGHVTALENHTFAFDDDEGRELEELKRMANEEEYKSQELDFGYNKLKHELGYTPVPLSPHSYSPNETLPSPYNHLDTLRRDYNNGSLSAIAYIQDLQDFTEDCLHEHPEWKADERAEIHKNHNISYPKRDYLARPQSWDAPDGLENTAPRIIEGSRPLRPGLNRRHYRNSCATHSRATYYHTAQPRPPLEPEGGNVIPATPPHPTTLRIGRQNNNMDNPIYHINSDNIPYSTSRSRPLP
jgi:hypothetical protein